MGKFECDTTQILAPFISLERGGMSDGQWKFFPGTEKLTFGKLWVFHHPQVASPGYSVGMGASSSAEKRPNHKA